MGLALGMAMDDGKAKEDGAGKQGNKEPTSPVDISKVTIIVGLNVIK